MFIELYESKGYKRFMLASTPRFRMEMSDVVQIILGTNGSGKTSLVRDMSVLPGIKDHYIKGGYKKVIVTHNGDRYRLESHFDGAQEHYFIKNETEDLNPGRTLTVQRELVKKVFGVTQDIHDLLVGDETFTAMSPARRREWLTRLCDTDYNYSIGVFKKVMEKHRDTVGALKLLKSRLAEETSKRLSDETIADIRRRLVELTQESQKLYALKNLDSRDKDEISPIINDQIALIKSLDARFRKLRSEFSHDNFLHPEELQDDLNDCIASLKSNEIRYQQHSERYMAATDELSKVKSASNHSIPELVQEIDALRNKKAKLLEQGCRYVQYTNPVQTYQALEEHYNTFLSIFTDLEADPNKEINRENYEAIQELVENTARSINQTTALIEKLHHKREHYENLKATGSVTCPSCTFSWIRDYDADAHSRVLGEIEKLQSGLDEAKLFLAEKQATLARWGAYVRKLDPYNQLARHNLALREICQYLAEKDMVKSNPKAIVLFIEGERIALQSMQEIPEIDKTITEKLNALQLAQNTQNFNEEGLKRTLEREESAINALIEERSMLAQRKESIERYIAQMNTFADIEQRLRTAADKLEKLLMEHFDATRNVLIDELLVETHGSIAQLRNHLNEIDNREAVLNELSSQIATLEKQEKAYKEVANALSPVDGLIAEGMLGFIRHYVDAMNALIERVWSYPLRVKDCSLEEDTAELNYKFPMEVGNSLDLVPDVSKGSSGMKDIVNMAFKVVAMHKAGLQGYPLVLDEFGKAFDEEHREAAMRAIKHIIDSLGFSQIFMISHYESCWGAFDNAQICVLDKRNITLPAGLRYNTHVQMTA